jgi:hypothetical protein
MVMAGRMRGGSGLGRQLDFNEDSGLRVDKLERVS